MQKPYKIIFFFLRNYITPSLCILFLSLGYAFFESINVAAIFPMVSSILTDSKSTVAYGKIIENIYRLLKYFPHQDLFITSCVLLILSALLKFVFFLSFTYLSNKLSLTVRSDLQNQIFKIVLDADCQFFSSNKQGAILYRILNAPANVMTILRLIPDIFIHTIKIVFLLVLLFSISHYAFICLLFVGFLFGFVIKKFSNTTYYYGNEITQAGGEQTSIANETITGIRQIQIYMSRKIWQKRFQEQVKRYYHYKLKSQIINITPAISLEPIIILAIGVTGIFIRLKHDVNFIDVIPMLTIYAFAIIRINPSIASIGQQRMLMMNVLPDLEICHAAVTVPSNNIKDGIKEIHNFTDEISFEDIDFRYPNRDLVFERLSMTIKKGQVTAIVGPSGAGKSTLMDLLVRLYDPDKGRIKIDKLYLKDIIIDSWRRKIGYVSQDSFIFHSTIKENITFGEPGYCEDDILRAAQLANAHEFICDFPDGYDTIVGDRGVKLSGGQKQRIAIARAIIRKPEIIIFDEATSALDNISEKIVQNAIERISEEYTVIIVAHRLSTIQKADKILVLNNRGIEEEGTHTQLMERQGTYWKLYNEEF